MRHDLFKYTIFTLLLNVPLLANATMEFENKDKDSKLTVSGELRASYQENNFENKASDQKIKFNTAILNIGYSSPNIFGNFQYRCYQFDTLCDFSTLVQANAGYHLNSTDNLKVGLQPIPFGPGQFWDSSFYEGINTTMGLQDTMNLGVNYHFELPSFTKVDLAYFVADGGNYYGKSKDAARYTANMVKSADLMKTNLNEKNMWLVRVDQDLKFLTTEDLKVSVGGSYWYSEIENKKIVDDGARNSWALFNRIRYKNLNVMLTGGKQSINNKDLFSPYSSTFGSYDGEYDIANKGFFYTVNTSYAFNNVWDSFNITPYMVFSAFNKKEKDFDDSQRNILGVEWDYKKITLYTEYMMSKNDPFIGGTANSLATGDGGKWKNLLNMMFIYKF